MTDDDIYISRDSCNSPLRRMGARTIAVKFCGGCNPTYERMLYWERIKAAAAGVVNWVGTDQPDVDGILLICGCLTACPEKDFHPTGDRPLTVVRDEHTAPAEIIKNLLM